MAMSKWLICICVLILAVDISDTSAVKTNLHDVVKREDNQNGTSKTNNNNTTTLSHFSTTTTVGTNNVTNNQSIVDDKKSGSFFGNLEDNRDMLMRTFYVLISVTAFVVLYFIVKAVRVRHRKSKTRRYGLLAGSGDKMEMTPLDQEDDDEEDVTVFEMNGKRR